MPTSLSALMLLSCGAPAGDTHAPGRSTSSTPALASSSTSAAALPDGSDPFPPAGVFTFVRPNENWRLADAGFGLVVLDRIDDRGTRIAIFDAVRRELVASMAGWTAGIGRLPQPTYYAFRPLLLDRSTLLSFWDENHATAWNPRSGRMRWTHEAPVFASFLAGGRSVGNVIQLLGPNNEMIALDLENGEELWRRSIQFGTGAPAVSDGERTYHFEKIDKVMALDARTGTELWSLRLPEYYGLRQILIDGSSIILSHHKLHWLDPKTGKELASVPQAAQNTFGVIVGGAVVQSGEALPGTMAVTRDGVRWQRDDIVFDWMVPVGSAVIGCGGGVLRALDGATGTELWSWGLEQCVTPSHRISALVVDEPAPVTLAASTSSGVHIITDVPSIPTKRVTVEGTINVNGKPATNAKVMVYGMPVTTDTKGRYSKAIAARGTVSVVLEREEIIRISGEPCTSTVSAHADVAEGEKLTLDLRANADQGEGCGCHCD